MAQQTPRKPFPHTKEHAARVNQAHRRMTLECTAEIQKMGDALAELAEGKHRVPVLRGHGEVLRLGGTLTREHVADLNRNLPQFSAALRGIVDHVGDLTHGTLGREITLKSYSKRKKPSLGPHRDNNLEGPASRPAVISMISILGLRQSAIWAVPQGINLPGSDAEVMRRAGRKECLMSFRGILGANTIELTPFSVTAQGPGDATFIDERPPLGVWEDPKYGNMAIWHSVYGNFVDEPASVADGMVVSLILRGGRSQQQGMSLPSKP